MSQERRCPQCGAELPANTPQGLCPACLLEQGIESQRATAGSPSGPQGSPSTPAFTPASPADLAPHFPNLEILELLGQGGMGAVYKARQPGLDRLVALKVLPPGIGHDAAFAERFKREARSLARLNHPNIVAVYDFGEAAGLFYFVMEYVDGVNLRQMERAERVAPREALGIVVQVCEALQFAHDEGIIHRDIKPENILLDKKGRVKIADFGLAKLLAKAPADYTLTQPQQVMGTVHYMAPEQLEHPAEVDQRADIYSLGVVFYEMLTGELPIGRFAPPSQKFQVDVRLDEVVLKALEKEPSRRYQHASEVRTDVEQITGTPPPAAPATSQAAPGVAAPPARATDARRWWFMVPAIGLLVTGILDCLSTLLIALALVCFPYSVRESSHAVLPGEHMQPPAVVEAPLAVILMLGFLVLGLGIGVLIIVGSIKMMRLRSAALAKTSAVLALIPFPNPATWLLGLPMGIWALVVLSRPEVEAAFAATAKPPVPADRVRRPAIGLIVAAVINAMIYFLVQMMGLEHTLRFGEPAGLIAASVGAILVSLLIILAAWRMMSLRSYGLAVAGSILALIPLGPGWLIGLPFGIWALAMLTRPDVKAAFGAAKGRSAGGPAVTEEAASKEPPPPEQPGSAPGGLPPQAAAQHPGKGRQTRTAWIVAAIIVGALVLLAVPIVGGLVLWLGLSLRPVHVGPAEPPGEVESATAVLPEPDGPRITIYYWGHYSDPAHPNPYLERVITKTGVEVDRTISSTSSGEGSLRVVADGPTVVRLFEHGPTAGLYRAGPYDVDNSRLTYQAKLRTWGLQGRACLEMRCHFPNGEEFVSRGSDKPVSGTTDWTSAETSFVVKGAKEPDNVQLNLVIDGKGTVWIDDVGLTLRPRPAGAPAAPTAAAPADLTLGLGGGATMKMVRIPAGKFMMGAAEDRHAVTLSKPFHLGVTEVTQAQYEAVMGADPSEYKGATTPVECVSWDDAAQFCRKLSEKTGQAVRLPTEAEWEYACRAGTQTEFSFGDDPSALGDYAWHGGNSGNYPHPVGQKKPNAWGLYDMHGNVHEWCADWHGEYPKGPATDPTGPASGTVRVLRGGSWGYDKPVNFQCANRQVSAPADRFRRNGFRVVVSVPGSPAPAAPATDD